MHLLRFLVFARLPMLLSMSRCSLLPTSWDLCPPPPTVATRLHYGRDSSAYLRLLYESSSSIFQHDKGYNVSLSCIRMELVSMNWHPYLALPTLHNSKVKGSTRSCKTRECNIDGIMTILATQGVCTVQSINQSISLAVWQCLCRSRSSFRLVALLFVTLGLLPSLAPYFTSPSGPGQPRLAFRSWNLLRSTGNLTAATYPSMKYLVASTTAASSC